MRIFVVWLIFLFLSVAPVKAARNLSITSDKTSINGDDNLQINASASGFLSDETIYIKGAFYKDGSTNYFGYTKFGDVWVKNSAASIDQYRVKISDWDSTLNIKSDFSDTGFSGNGDYKFKVGFYYTTSGGNLSAVNWSSNSVTISLSAPSPTPTEAPSPTKSPVPIIVKTASPIPIKTHEPTPLTISTKTPNILLTNNTEDEVDDQNLVLSTGSTTLENASGSSSESSRSGVLGVSNNNYIMVIVLIGLGSIFISTSIYMAYQTSKNDFNFK